MPVEKGTFQDLRIEILTTTGERVKFKDSTSPSKVVLHFRRRAYKIYTPTSVTHIHNEGSLETLLPSLGGPRG
jgi:hypothetical protein